MTPMTVFVILADINALAEASSALSFAIQNLGKPIIFSGNVTAKDFREMGYFRGDASRSKNPDLNLHKLSASVNFNKALEAAEADIAGVFVLSGNELLHGVRTYHYSTNINGFRFFRRECQIEVDGRSAQIPNFYLGFNDNLAVINIDPSFKLPYLERIVLGDSQPDGVVLDCVYDYNDLPIEIENLLEEASRRKLPIVMTREGSQSPLSVGVGREAEERFPALIIVQDMTWPALITKFEWALGQNPAFEDIRKIMQTNLVGELAPHPPLTHSGVLMAGGYRAVPLVPESERLRLL